MPSQLEVQLEAVYSGFEDILHSQVEGHHIRVDRAGRSSKATMSASSTTEYDRSSSIFLGNLPFDVTVCI